MKLLLHICCAPCIAAPLAELRRQHDVTGFFHNPNIHPLLEFRKRLRAVEVFAEQEKLSVIYRRDYGLASFLRQVGPDTPDRCTVCYRMRVDAVARAAREGGFAAFTTSLLFSRQQRHDRVKEIAAQAAEREGVQFLYADLRHMFDQSMEIARKRSLYRQQYCGCIFSEYERYSGRSEVRSEK